MSTRLEQLYQDVILDHNKNPKNFLVLEPHSHAAHGKNPLCGDDYWVYLNIKDDIIESVSFHGTGCAISKASASLLTGSLKGKTLTEALNLKDQFIELVTKDKVDETTKSALGRLAIFEGVKKFPVRVKCAALAWRALEAAVEQKQTEITTE